MKTSLFATLFLVLIGLSVPVFSQDLGAPDSLILIPSTELDATGNDSLLVLEVWAFNDGQGISIQAGFEWDSEQLTLDSAKASPQVASLFNYLVFFDGWIEQSNTNNRAVFSGISFSGKSLPASPNRKLIASYYFTVSDWTVNSVITVDSASWDDGSEMLFIDQNFNSYLPVWNWGTQKLVIKDVNAVECDPPSIVCLTYTPTVDLCGPDQVCIDLPIYDADNVTVEGATWSNGQLCFQADATGTYDFHVEASVNCGEMTSCDFSVDVNIASAPDITCPAVAFNETLCAPGQVCVPLTITGATNVNAGSATWSNGQLCFQADTAGTYQIQVTATNNAGCGEDNCTVTVMVAMQGQPVITCPPDAQVLLCAPGQFCTALDIAGATDVSVEGASWVDGILCFDATATGNYSFEVTASNPCEQVSCTVSIDIVIEGTPEITCPTETVTQFLCEAGQVCVPLPIAGATDVTSNIGTWADGQLCFQANTAGSYDIQIEASNSCGFQSCDFTVNVEIGAAPAITCPGAPVEVFIQYANQVCVNLPVSGAANVAVDNGGAWAAGQLCFQADTTGNYAFHVTASSDCGEATCDLTVAVDITPPCVNIVLSDTALLFTAFQGDVTPTPESFTVTVSSTTDSIPFDFTISGMEGGITVEPAQGTTPTEVVISGDVSSLPIGINLSTLTISSTSDRVCDPRMAELQVRVDIYKQPSADTVIVADVPAVPGMQVTVPITFTNSCFLQGAAIDLSWPSSDIFLDSVSFEGSAVAGFVQNTVIDNDVSTVMISSSGLGLTPVSPGSGNLWANLHFTVSCETAPGVYPIGLYTGDFHFDRNCGDGSETDVPEFIGGGILVDETENYVCGWVVTPNAFGGYDEVETASVEMWSAFPLGELLNMTTSGHNGAFAFDEFMASRFDLYAYAEGYYPGTVNGIGFGEKGVMIVLYPLADLIPTDMWVDYYCETNTTLGVPMPVGTVVEVIDPQGTLCGRQIVTEPGVYRFMPVYRDSSSSTIDEGATTGDILTFLVNGEGALASGNVIYPSAYDQIEVCLEAGAKLTKTCELMEGWNLVSWNLNTESDYIEDILAGHMECIDVVLGFERGGLTYDPDLPQFSTLWYADHLSGYWIKVKNNCQVTLELEGLPVLASTPIVVNSGWNLVSYLADASLAPEDALASVYDNLLIAYGSPEGIQIHVPGQGQFNTLLEMSTCLGYWLKVSANDQLIYPSNGPVPAVEEINPLIAEAARLAPFDVTPTTSWMNLYATDLTLDGEKVQAGADLAAYSPQGNKIGGFTMTKAGTFGFMPVYADDAGNQGVTGLKPGDKFYLTVDGVETAEQFTWTQTGDNLEVRSLVSLDNSGNIMPDNYLLGQNYPNPFNPTTSITFSVPTAQRARLEVFNVLGKLIAVPFDGTAMAGENTVVWDGHLTNGQTASSGVYFYRLTSDGFDQTKKMMLLK